MIKKFLHEPTAYLTWAKMREYNMSVRVGKKKSLVMLLGDPRDGFFYPTLTRIMDSFFAHHCIYLFKNKLPEVSDYATMQFHMMTSP